MKSAYASATMRPSALLRYSFAIGVAVLALLGTLLIRSVLREQVFALFFVAVLVSTWYGGLGSSLLTTALSALLAAYFIFPQQGQFDLDTITRLGVEVLAALLISWLTATRRRVTATLDEQREQLQVTLASIGDAVITTDNQGHVTFLNGVAEALTGWSLAAALGQPSTEVFHIINADTRQLVESPIVRVLREGMVVGLANHTVLIARDGSERPIDDSGAPIRDRAGQLIGVVLVFRDMTERVQAAAALQDSRDQLAVILSGVADGIVAAAPSGRLVYANAAAAQMIGYPSVDAMLSAPSHERLQRFVIMDEAGQPLTPSQLPGRLVFQGEQQASRVLRYRNLTTSQEHWAMVQARPVRDAQGEIVMSIAIMHDMTAQKQAESERAQLLAREQAARMAADTSKRQATFLADASRILGSSLDYTTTLANVAQLSVPLLADWCGVYMRNEQQAIQLLAVAHIDPAKVELAHELYRRYPPASAAANGVSAVLRSGQAELIAAVSDDMLVASAVDAEHLALLRTVGFSSVMIVPITVREQTLAALIFVSSQPEHRYGLEDSAFAEELARRAAQAIDNAQLYQDARHAVQLRDQFLSIAAHELRTPLTALMGQAQFFQRRAERDKHLAERDQRALGLINTQIVRLNKLVGALLDVSRLETGQLSIDRSTFDLCALVRQVVSEIQPTIQGRALDLRNPAGPIMIDGDELRLEQVLQNLIQNAIKYSQPPQPITVSVAQTAQQARVSVQDHGMGIPAAALPNLFQRFYRAENVHAQHISGIGIGLYVVKEIVTLHGGTVTVESTEGVGSIFTIYLPLALPS